VYSDIVGDMLRPLPLGDCWAEAKGRVVNTSKEATAAANKILSFCIIPPFNGIWFPR
jgi:hypothetical protein